MQVGPVTLRKHQVESYRQLQDAVRDCVKRGLPPHVILQAGCGYGKTTVSTAIMQNAMEKGKKCLFLASGRQLIFQKSDRLAQCWIKHGVMMSDSKKYINTEYATPCEGNPQGFRALVASKDTVESRVKNERITDLNFDVVIVDECHLAMSKIWQDIITMNEKAVVIGLSATPARGNGKGLGDFYNAIVTGAKHATLVNGGFMVPCRVIAPWAMDMTGVNVNSSTGEYVLDEVDELYNQSEIIGDIVESWHRHGENRKTLVFASSVEHAIALKHEFEKGIPHKNLRGVPSEYVEANTPPHERKEMYERLVRGDLKVLTNFSVLRTGVDFPPVECIQLAVSMNSLNSYMQSVGRGFRTSQETGKHDCIVLDHGGNVHKHGWPQWDRVWDLDAESKTVLDEAPRNNKDEPQEREPITCPKCAAMRERGPECPNCGHRHKKTGLKVRTAKGKLVEITEKNLNIRKKKKDDKSDHQKLWLRLLAIAARKGWPYKVPCAMFKKETGLYPEQAKVGPLTESKNYTVYVSQLWPGFGKRTR